MKKIRNCSTFSRQIKKLHNTSFSKTKYIGLFPLVNLYDFCLEETVPCNFNLLDFFLDFVFNFHPEVFNFQTRSRPRLAGILNSLVIEY